MQTPVNQNSNVENSNVENVKVKSEVSIVWSEQRTCFFVTGTQNNDPVKKILKEDLKGIFNHKMQGYKFATRDYGKVCTALGLEKDISFIDPKKVIEVTFTKKFQWDGDIEHAEQFLKQMGLAKQTKSSTNLWTGPVELAPTFLQAFQVKNN